MLTVYLNAAIASYFYVLEWAGPSPSIGVGTGGRAGGLGPLNFLFEDDQYDRAPTFEKCRPIFELKVTPYFQS